RRSSPAGNKLPLEISESLLLPSSDLAWPRDQEVARNNFIVFLSLRRGNVLPEGPRTARQGTGRERRERKFEWCKI
ncbi:hypothetical protein WH47_05911, partial [Habropoda laboriosa]